MEAHMQRFHGTAARQLVLIENVQSPGSRVQSPGSRVQGPARIRLMQKDLYAELTRRRRRAQIAARHIIDAPQE
ncbi:MAG: hypothetical protein IPL75_06090 [Acidobacteria bacterium]|nr:hypothetical protein [Acidobacteriota bacterium]